MSDRVKRALDAARKATVRCILNGGDDVTAAAIAAFLRDRARSNADHDCHEMAEWLLEEAVDVERAAKKEAAP